MKKPSLHLVVEHLKRRRDDATRVRQRAQAELDGARGTLASLRDYGEEQAARRREGRASPVDANRLASSSAFAVKLDEAIEAQSERVDGFDRRASTLRAELLAHQRRLKAVEHLVERRRIAAEKRAARLEKHGQDEWVNARHARKEKVDDPAR